MSALPDPVSMRPALLEHFDAHARALPWREDREPYRVWVSEVMLQQTRVETATPYYERWMERFPSLSVLAEADEEAVLKAWEGLGYYSRARNLHRAARIVRERLNGCLPDNAHALRELPGIGEYSAGAIASISYGEAVPAVDGNARRVISRLFDLVCPSRAELRARATEILDPRRPGDWNQAIMELGATICLPRSPRCGECPVAEHCRARAEGTQEARPLAKPRPRVRKASIAVLVAVRDGALLLTRRPSEGLLGGLWEFPSLELRDVDLMGACREVAESCGVEIRGGEARWSVLPRVRHLFSHLDAVYRPVLVSGVSGVRVGDMPRAPSLEGPTADRRRRWVRPDEVSSLPLSVAQRKILALALEETTDLEFGPAEAERGC